MGGPLGQDERARLDAVQLRTQVRRCSREAQELLCGRREDRYPPGTVGSWHNRYDVLRISDLAFRSLSPDDEDFLEFCQKHEDELTKLAELPGIRDDMRALRAGQKPLDAFLDVIEPERIHRRRNLLGMKH